MGNDFIDIRNPRELGVDRLPAERVPVGEVGEYKPCIATLRGDELLLVAYLSNVPGLPTVQHRSFDGGRTWSDDEKPGHGGGEPWLSRLSSGALLLTGGPWGWRSEDGGRSWVKCVQPEAFAARVRGNNSRNILELRDGSLLQIVDVPREKERAYQYGDEQIARSTDGGLTWLEVYPVQVAGIPDSYPGGVFLEAHLWQAPSGKLYSLARVDHRYCPLPGRKLTVCELLAAACDMMHFGLAPVQDIAETSFDHFNRLRLFSSVDLGRTWQPAGDLGDYGFMYPSILRLQDGRLLLTLTVRSIDPPVGVRAVVGAEEDDGFHFDFDHDVIMIDTKTPIVRTSGGGFGPTIQLEDGTLVTSYSYWCDNTRKPGDWSLPIPFQCEVVRWRLPSRGSHR